MKKFYFLFLFALIASVSNLWAAEKTVTYTFKSAKWTADEGNWTSIKDGASTSSGCVQVTTNATGASAKSPESFNNVTNVDVYYHTNKSNGAGTINITIGNNDVITKSVSTSGGTTSRKISFVPSSSQSGDITIKVNCTKNSIYIDKLIVTYTYEEKLPQCAAPTFSLENGTYFEDKLLEFSSTTTGSTIHYTVNDGAETTGDSINFTINGTYVVSAWATKEGYEDSDKSTVSITINKGLVFYESFDKCSGTGGNDGQWSGSIATSNVNTDNTEWTCLSWQGANKCVKVGTSGKAGTATTPALTKLDGDATITFRAGAWKSDGNKLTVTASKGTLSGDTNVTLADSQFKDYTVTITGGDATTKITFAVDNKRFFLDEVRVVAVQASNVATPTFTPASGDVNLDSKITMASATEGATISYSTDEGATWTDGAEYSATAKGALTLWAKATKDGEESAVAKTTFNVIDPNEIGEIVVNVTADKTAASDKYFGTMTVNVPMPVNATEMEVVITKDGAAYSSDKNLTDTFSKEIKETGKYVITVTANNDVNIDSNEEAPKTVDFYSSSLGSIAEFLLYAPENETTFGSKLEYAFTCPLTVTYANGNNLWVTDGTDGLLIYDRTETYNYANGTVFSAGLKGTYTVYNQTIELTNATLTATSTGAEASPKAIEIAGITKDNQNQYVIIADAVFDASKSTLADAAGNSVTCYTGKDYCTVPADGTYDVVGIVNYFGYSEASSAVQVYPLAFLNKPVVTAGFTKAEIAAKPWLAEKDVVLTTEEEDLKASCVKLTCQDGAQIVYSLQGSDSEVGGTADSGVELTLSEDVYELTVQTVANGFKGVAVNYIFTVGDTSSVSKVSAEDGVKVVAAEGGVEVVATEAADVAVYTVAGQLVRAQRVAEGSTLVNVPAGFYVVRAAGTVAKVVVK